MPIAVASDRHRPWPEHCHTVLADLPVGEVATADRSPVRFGVTFADPADDSPPGVCVDVTEGPFGHPVAKIVTPAPQHRIQLAQQVSKRSMPRSAGGRPDPLYHRGP